MIKIEKAYIYQEALPLNDQIYKDMESILTADQKSYGDKRKMEYLAGRYCAQNALKLIGIENTDIPIQEDRSPLWPKGIVGSITHTKGIAIAAVSKELKGIGVDAEILMTKKRFENIAKMIVSDKEKLFVEQDLALYPTLVFSAKESLYKAIYPLCKQYFGFLEACLVDVKSNTFKLLLHSNQAQVAPFNDEYQGYFEVFDQTLISWITIK